MLMLLMYLDMSNGLLYAVYFNHAAGGRFGKVQNINQQLLLNVKLGLIVTAVL